MIILHEPSSCLTTSILFIRCPNGHVLTNFSIPIIPTVIL